MQVAILGRDRNFHDMECQRRDAGGNSHDMLVDVETGQFVSVASSEAGNSVVLAVLVAGGLLLIMISIAMLVRRGRNQRA